MQAIETVYKGYRFRSRLEARWAVFFDALGIKWEYEKEGYEFKNGTKYLPDFYLEEQDLWVEIKGKNSGRETEGLDKICQFQNESGRRVVLLAGTPGEIIDPYDDNVSYTGYIPNDSPYFWCECPTCGSIDVQFDGRSARNKHKDGCEIYRLRMEGMCHPIWGRTDDKVYNYDSPRLIAAYNAARSARFEHGEHGS